jgi:hypothetical protein
MRFDLSETFPSQNDFNAICKEFNSEIKISHTVLNQCRGTAVKEGEEEKHTAFEIEEIKSEEVYISETDYSTIRGLICSKIITFLKAKRKVRQTIVRFWLKILNDGLIPNVASNSIKISVRLNTHGES